MGECVGSVKVFGGSGSEVWSTRWGSVKVFEGKGSGVWRTRWGNVWGV